MSHLSDVQDGTSLGVKIGNFDDKINFVKWLIIKYSDTNVEIDADAEYELFLKR